MINLKIKKIDLVFIILFVILTIISIDFLLNTVHQKAIEDISRYEPFQNLITGLIITFWVCLIDTIF